MAEPEFHISFSFSTAFEPRGLKHAPYSRHRDCAPPPQVAESRAKTTLFARDALGRAGMTGSSASERHPGTVEEAGEQSRAVGVGQRALLAVGDARIGDGRGGDGVLRRDVDGSDDALEAYELAPLVDVDEFLPLDHEVPILQATDDRHGDVADQAVALLAVAGPAEGVGVVEAAAQDGRAVDSYVVAEHRGRGQR